MPCAVAAQGGLAPADVSLIGFHGQTILHRPEQRWTWQIGDGALLARLTGIDVVNDFRCADVKAGGQGAPLVPLYHARLVRRGEVAHAADRDGQHRRRRQRHLCRRDEILAFDTGPGNAPIDDWAHRHTGKPVDEDGALARAAAGR